MSNGGLKRNNLRSDDESQDDDDRESVANSSNSNDKESLASSKSSSSKKKKSNNSNKQKKSSASSKKRAKFSDSDDEDDYESDDGSDDESDTTEDDFDDDDDDDDDSSDGSDDDWNEKGSKAANKSKKGKTTKKDSKKSKSSKSKSKASQNKHKKHKKNVGSMKASGKSSRIDEEDDDDDDDSHLRSSAKKRQLSDVEEGELSDASERHNKNDSNNEIDDEQDDVDFSSTSSSSESSVFSDGYDSEMIGDDEDRKRLDNMTEKEREEEIYRRTEARDLLMKRFEINKKIKQQQKAAAKAEKEKLRSENRSKRPKKSSKSSSKPSKTSTSSKSMLDSSTKSQNDKTNLNESNQQSDDNNKSGNLNNSSTAVSSSMDRRKANESKRKDTDRSKALANLKADREKKKQIAEDNKQRLEKLQQQQKKLRTEDVFSSSSSDEEESSRSKNRHKSSDSNSSNDDSDQDDSDEDESGSASDDSDSDQLSRTPINTKEDLNKIKMSRFKIEKWCHAPFFKKVACGCFVRIGIGLNNGVSIYRVAEITDVVETAKVYQLGPTKTNKGFKLKHGEEERTYRLEFVSNQPFTDDEFKRWKDALSKSGKALPSMRDVETKSKEIQSYVNYRFKEEDVDYIVKEKKRFTKDNDKIAEKKIELLKIRKAAEQSNDMEKVKEIDVQIEDLNEKATDLNIKRSGNFNMLASINQRNRELSNLQVEEAMKKEFERLKEQKDDPFQRRKGFPTLISAIKKGSSNDLAKTASKEAEKTNGENKQPNVQDQSKNKKTQFEDLLAPVQPESQQPKKEEPVLESFSLQLLQSEAKANQSANKNSSSLSDLFQAHDFEINIDLAVPLNTSNQLQPMINTSNVFNSSHLSKRALNLDEYKKKKGLI